MKKIKIILTLIITFNCVIQSQESNPKIMHSTESGESFGYKLKNLPSLWIYGKLISYFSNEMVSTFKIETKYIYGERANEIVEIKTLKTNYILQPNILYAFKFTFKRKIVDIWEDVFITEDFSEYKEQFKNSHKNDIVRRYNYNTELCIGCKTDLPIILYNKQNDSISYKIKQMKLVNEEAAQPFSGHYQFAPYNQRIDSAEIKQSVIYFDTTKSTLAPYETKIIKIQVYIPNGTDLSKKYIKRDNYEKKINCQILTANENRLMLWAEIEFKDELGNIHLFPEQGAFVQSLKVSK